jgi:hypothetical protein
MTPLRTAAAVLAVAGAGLVGFGWWGVNTAAGQRRYDEMAGMIPFFAEVAGAILLVVAFLLLLLSARRRPILRDHD